MPFDALTTGTFSSYPLPRNTQKIAVIGGGISGMGAAYMLGKTHQVTLFESEPKLGGHARTVMAGKNGDQPVDTGFIVFNHENYPYMSALFDQLNVPTVKSNMSFGASIDGGRLEYALTSLDALFAQRRNAVTPAFLGMVRDILRFNKNAVKVAEDRSLSLGAFLERLGTGDWFRDYYMLPLSGAIWSTPTEKIMDFPAHAMVQFFKNHALLGVHGQHQWHTVQGGSRQYVDRLETALRAAGTELRTGAAVHSVTRGPGQVTVRTWGGEPEVFDHVVFATHSDDSLRLLTDPSEREEKALGAIAYQPNDIVLHCDTSLMPKRRKTWASWVYTEDKDAKSDRIDLTYWMNSLQPIPEDDLHFVTLNTKRRIREELIYDSVTLRHPVYDLAALQAQKDVQSFNGAQNTWFCGAWMKNGFHEDGLSSAVDVVRALRSVEQERVAAE
ncbi:FAD-dependent oxidoreductase [uncultured Roseobacter sp.]|uniref:NAD(P)/FAD-dependent oxidoreductase n=1 Tax=uncultured Roseobacter sp. TaxID=114847 RepID=UPI00260AC02D|nr:FAD-dependent oxidoreductase [uncultured Roseobacter sp.]